MAKDGNTYAKKARETLKRQKAQEKRERRQKRKDMPEAYNSAPADPRENEAGAANDLVGQNQVEQRVG
jgi:hypothetical protein